MKKSIAFVIALGLSLSISPVAIGDVPEENFYPSVKQEAGWMGYNTDNSIEYSQPSSLYAMSALTQPEFVKSMYVCQSLESKECSSPEIGAFTFTSIFTKCQSDADTDCIDSFNIKNEDGSISSATFQRNWVPGPVYQGNKSKFLPTGYGPNSWTLTNSKGVIETYALSVGVMGHLDLVRNPNKTNFESFIAAVQPIKEVAGAGYDGPVANVTKRAILKFAA